jgi:RNA polymerase sigma-70 factor (ECF subfamily)
MNDDELIVREVLGGDQEAFRRLIHKHEKLVYHMVSRVIDSREDREDLCQEIFLKVYRKLPGFRFQSRLSTWIATVAYRTALNYLKKHKKRQTSSLDDISRTMAVQQTSSEQQLDQAGINRHVHQLIGQLPEKYRMVLSMYHLEEMPYAEIAQICDMPEGTVKNYIFRARKLLKEKLEKLYQKEELL